MSKGKRRQQREQAKAQQTVQDLEQHKGLSKYQRKKMEQRGIDIRRIVGGA